MRKQVVISIFTALVAVTGVTVATAQSSLAQERNRVNFYCKFDGIHPVTKAPIPVTIARGPIGEIPVIYWIRSMGSLTPETRCHHVSSKFDSLQKAGSLEYISHGYMRGQPVICTANYNGGPCANQLFTLHHQDNPQAVLETLLGVQNLASEAVFMGGAVQNVNGTYYIDLPLFLDYRNGEQ
ncbi:MAG: hypothetical protein F6J86_24595 [Symploca sp. SIO1B1]|nr:hypothetical protein [Symploca sp. SIO1A3]NER96990.1 hypothetical protein [Symploca sp. SIO1B1]